MSPLSLADIDELARLQRKILHCSALIDQLLEREAFQGRSNEAPDGNAGGVTMRNTLVELLDDITEAARGMVAIVNRVDESGAK
jgi:hypothetical protein